jgi:hypothetical protein
VGKRKKQEAVEHMLHVLSNDPQTWKYDLLEMLLQGVLANQIGYMDALNRETGVTERLLVGLEPNAQGLLSAYPLARMLDPEEANLYIAPDGKGGWDGLDEQPAAGE